MSAIDKFMKEDTLSNEINVKILKQYVYTHGSAKSIGKAVSWILDGLLKPMSYIPLRSCSDLNRIIII